uniref:hypothetical protein n=1 Tax=Pricia sp. TaxID=2268138 RepID=UPI003594762B
MLYENLEVERTDGHFIENAEVNPDAFNGQDFLGVEASYNYQNFDNASLPKTGIGIGLTAGYKANLKEDRSFAYLIPELRLTTKIDKSGILVYATKFKGHFNFGNEFDSIKP